LPTQVDEDIEVVLECIYKIDEKAGGGTGISGEVIHRHTGLRQQRINDAVELLSQGGLIEMHTAIGTYPYNFHSVSITPKGKREFQKEAAPHERQEPVGDPRTVFVVHGRNDAARNAIFTFLRAIGLHPLEWSEAVAATRKGAPYIGEILDSAFTKARAVIVLMTPDDEGRLRGPFRKPEDAQHEVELTPQARLNVLFEAGMAMGRFPERTILVELGNVRPFSDIGGRHIIKLDDTAQRRKELAGRLETARCQVNLGGTDWLSAGAFEESIRDTPED